MTRLLKLTAASALLLGCASCSTLAPPSTAAATATAQAQTTKLKGSTPSYDLQLELSGPQKIYSMADYKAQNPTSGEILLSGQMTTMKSLPAGTSLHQLVLHVLHVFSDTPIHGASVSMTLTSSALKSPIHVPIAVVQSVKPGNSEWLYGNNVALAPGNYTVSVVVNAERATFHLAVLN